MDAEGISAELRDFMRAHVRTYEQLETLLLMVTRPDQDWSADSIAAALKIPIDVARDALRELASDLVLQSNEASPEAYRLAGPEVCRIVCSLADVYTENRLLVMRLMNENALERMRTEALHAFSSAFLIRKGKKDG
jgi:hypothetical protein